jgi:hypothetical protein
MNTKILSATAIIATILAILSASLASQQSEAASRALARARKAEAAVAQTKTAEDHASWDRLEKDAAILATDLTGSEREQVVRRLNENVRRLRSRYGYPQLRLADGSL